MAKVEKTKAKQAIRKAQKDVILPLERSNYIILGIGVITIILGYMALSAQPWDNFIALNVAPILLVLGYCVFIPLGIIFRKRKPAQTIVSTSTPEVTNQPT